MEIYSVIANVEITRNCGTQQIPDIVLLGFACIWYKWLDWIIVLSVFNTTTDYNTLYYAFKILTQLHAKLFCPQIAYAIEKSKISDYNIKYGCVNCYLDKVDERVFP